MLINAYMKCVNCFTKVLNVTVKLLICSVIVCRITVSS